MQTNKLQYHSDWLFVRRHQSFCLQHLKHMKHSLTNTAIPTIIAKYGHHFQYVFTMAITAFVIRMLIVDRHQSAISSGIPNHVSIFLKNFTKQFLSSLAPLSSYPSPGIWSLYYLGGSIHSNHLLPCLQLNSPFILE